jgi:biotin operon repressor
LDRLRHEGYGLDHYKVKALQMQIDRLRKAEVPVEVGWKESEKLRTALLAMEQLRDEGYGPDHYKVKALQMQIDRLREWGVQVDRVEADMRDSATLLSALLEKGLLEERYGPNHDKVKSLQSQINRLRKAGVKVDQKRAAEKLLSATLELEQSRNEGYGPKHAKIVVLERQVDLLRAEDVRIDRRRAQEELEKLVRRAAELQDMGFGDAHPDVRMTYAQVAYLAGVLSNPEK